MKSNGYMPSLACPRTSGSDLVRRRSVGYSTGERLHESGGPNMVPRELLDRVRADVRRHCESKGRREGPGVNNFVPHDCVAAFAMARRLIDSGDFDRYVAVAPEGHIYGYFLERLG